MARYFRWTCTVATVLCATSSQGQPPKAETRIIAVDIDRETAATLKPHVEAGQRRIEKYFGKPFPKPFEVEVLPNRASFDEYFQRRWKAAKTEPWMVGAGVADRFVLLSPRVWKTEAREHNPDDAGHLRDLVAHELVHVYHGQICPKPEFDGMDDMGWFVEGLAVYVSGQLEHTHRTAAADAIRLGKAPAKLADAWAGKHRYGVSGSLVEFVEKRYGRETIRKLLTITSNGDALKLLDTTEAQLLHDWSDSIAGRR